MVHSEGCFNRLFPGIDRKQLQDYEVAACKYVYSKKYKWFWYILGEVT